MLILFILLSFTNLIVNVQVTQPPDLAQERKIIPESSSATTTSGSESCTTSASSDDEDSKNAVATKTTTETAPREVSTTKKVYKPVVLEPQPSTSRCNIASFKPKAINEEEADPKVVRKTKKPSSDSSVRGKRIR